MLNALSEEMQSLFPNLTWKELVDEGYIIAGSPATVRERMEALIKSLRVGHIFCLIHIGNMPDWKTRYSTKLFAEQVMPHLRDMWPEWKDDNRWWCTPLDERLQPETGIEQARQDARMPPMNSRMIETGRGTKVHVLDAGSGEPLVFMHGAGGLFPENPFPRPTGPTLPCVCPGIPGLWRINRRSLAGRYAGLHPARLGCGARVGLDQAAYCRAFDGRYDSRGNGGPWRRTTFPSSSWSPQPVCG